LHSKFSVYITASSSAVKRVVFVNEGVPYTVIRGRWCNTIAVNVPAPSEKSDNSNESFYDELEQISVIFSMKILFGDFNAKVGRENIFKPTIENESLH